MTKKWKPISYGYDIEKVFKTRGINDISRFLNPLEQMEEINPFEFKNMNIAVDRVSKAINEQENVLIIADVDVDGITSGVITYCGLLPYFDNLSIIVGEGKKHGMSQFDLDLFDEYQLIIACDSGSNEYERYRELYELGKDIILLDHHKADHEEKRYVYATVNSEMFDSPNTSLSGAGVCLKFLQALSERFVDVKPEDYYDLAAVGLVADMMNMSVEDNRVICAKGFANLKNKAIKEILGYYDFNSESIQFSIAPLVNACQRMNKNHLALELFLSDDVNEIREILKELNALKEKQNQLLDNMGDEIIEYDKIILSIVDRDEIKAGLTGLNANRIAQKKGKPVIALNRNENDEWRGSMRCPYSFNLAQLINETGLGRAEGHNEASGIFIEKDNIDKLIERLNEVLPSVNENEVIVDFELDSLEDLNFDIVSFVDKCCEISGTGFAPLSFMISDVKPDLVTTLKDRHTKIVVGNFTLFFWNNTQPAKDWNRNKWKSFDILGKPTISMFRGKKKINFILSDIDYELI